MISDKKMEVDSNCLTEKKMNLTKEKVEEMQLAEINILINNEVITHNLSKKKKIQDLKDKIDKDGVNKETLKELINLL